MPTLVNYMMNNNSIIIDLEGEVMELNLNGNQLTMTVPNGFVAKDIDTSETTISQDITYTFTR
jgi:hypothetical protein